MATKISIWILSDQKAGHENQSVGLAEAIGRRQPVEMRRLKIDSNRFFWRNIADLKRELSGLPAPDLLIGAGHRTHVPLLWAKWVYQRPVVVLMKPTLTHRWFDLCIMPEHDVRRRHAESNVIVTSGVLNRIVPPTEKKSGRGLFLIGGPSKEFAWEPKPLLSSIQAIVAGHPGMEWRLTDSRRTPDGFISRIVELLPQVQTFSHAETPFGWMPEQLARASTVWTTQDSVSMIYESLSSGASVGLLPTPRRRQASRLSLGVDRLVGEGMVSRFTPEIATVPLPAPKRVLAETDRCADEVLKRLFPGSDVGGS